VEEQHELCKALVFVVVEAWSAVSELGSSATDSLQITYRAGVSMAFSASPPD
jgi:hypothetical protein